MAMLNLLVVSPLLAYTLAQYTATYLPSNVPAQTEQGQFGTNKCGTGSNQSSICQNLYSAFVYLLLVTRLSEWLIF